MQVCVRDETPSGQSLWELSLELLSERITVRELLRERVHHEVREFNRQQDRLVFHGLVQPENAERTLNGSKLKAHRCPVRCCPLSDLEAGSARRALMARTRPQELPRHLLLLRDNGARPNRPDLIFPKWQRELFKTILDEESFALTAKANRGRRIA